MQPRLRLVSDAGHPAEKKRTTRRDAALREGWAASKFADCDRLEVNAADALLAQLFQDSRVLLIGFAPGYLSDLRTSLRSIGVAATGSVSDVARLNDVSEDSLGFTHLLVNIDAFDDVNAGVEAFVKLRFDAPDLIVVACSEFIGGDDFGAERARICDVTLKLPVSAPRLVNGLVTGVLNRSEAF